MKTRKIIMLLFISFIAVLVVAQDRIHGVDGYYLFSPRQIAMQDMLTVSNGKREPGWLSALYYEKDYIKVHMGIREVFTGNYYYDIVEGDTLSVLLATRADVGMKETFSGEGAFKVTKDFPVMAMKIAIPDGNERVNGNDYIELPIELYNRDTRALYGPGGTDGNRRRRIVEPIFPYIKDQNGLDSVRLFRRTETVGGVAGYVTMETFRIHEDGRDWAVFYVDLTPQFVNTSTQFPSGDSRPIDVRNFGAMFFTMADTIKTSPIWTDENNWSEPGGKRILHNQRLEGNPVKTRDEFGSTYIKWIGTFATAREVIDLVTNYNGEIQEPQALTALVGKVHEMQEYIKGYQFVDQSALNTYNAAVTAALPLCTSIAPAAKGTPEYIAWEQDIDNMINNLLQVQKDFRGFISTLPDMYYTIASLDGMYGVTLGETKTVGSYTGQILSTGRTASATGFMVKPKGESLGLKTYSLSTAQGTVIVSNDTLMLIPTNMVTASNPATFIFTNRYISEEPGYDMMANGKYYRISEMGILEKTGALPEASSIEGLIPYLHEISPAIYNPAGDNTDALLRGWEFNTPAAYSSNTDPFPNEDPFNSALDKWQSEFTRVDGWAKIRYQMQTEIYQATHEGEGCLVIKANESAYANSDLLFSENKNPIVYPASIQVGREHGTYNTNWTEPTVLRDSTFLVNLNAYHKRYLAMKWESNNPDILLTGLNFQAVKNVDAPSFNMSNLLGIKGNVYYWDMLANGIPYGTKGYMAQFLNFANFTSPNDRVYIDWIRTYASIDDIPNESFTSIENVKIELPVQVYSAGKTIFVNNQTGKNALVNVYRIDGVKVANKIIGQTYNLEISVNGFYIVSVKAENEKVVTVKLMIR